MTTASRSEMVDLDVVRSALAEEFDILDELGRGGMAIVFRARERELDREVALKVLPFSLAFDADFVERFQREARTAGRLEHPHIVPIYRVGRSGCVIYFTMQLLRGQSLSERLRERGRLTAPEVRRVLAETASALGYAAKHGVVHRDVKPDNILLDSDGRCVMTDFGIARSASEQRLTATGMSVGTPRYMSPEQARARDLDGRSDLYSLGIVAYECLVGRAPFESGDAFAILMAHINEPLPRPALQSEDERALFAVIERMLAKSPDDRFQTAEELIAALRVAPAGGAIGNQADASAASRRPSPSSAPTVPRGIAAPGRPLTPTRVAPAVTGWPAPDVRPSSGTGWPAPKVRPSSGTARLRARLEAAFGQAGRWMKSRQPGVARASGIVRSALGTAERGVRSRSRRFWFAAAGSVGLAVGGYYAIHFATMHRSRCPAPTVAATSARLTDGSADPAASPSAPLLLLVDAIGTRNAGSDLDVYYDVCGLEDGASFVTHISVRRAGFAIPGFRSPTIKESWNDRAGDNGARRHRELDFDGMPAGSYTVSVSMTDARGRSRERRVEFEVRK